MTSEISMAGTGNRVRRPVTTMAALALAASFVLPAAARADNIVETYLAPDVQATTTATLCAGQANCYAGTESFNELTPGNYTGQTVTTSFGSGGAITGTISGNYQINKADQYGGAGGTGNYIVTFDHNAGYTLNLATSSGNGVNYFGYDLTALDPGNMVSFYNNNTLVGTFTPSQMISALGACPTAYCGNPNSGNDPGEPFAFVNFYDTSGTFNKVVFWEGSNFGGGYEADNFTVAYRTATSTPGTVVPAPLPGLGATPLGLAIVGLIVFYRRKGFARMTSALA